MSRLVLSWKKCLRHVSLTGCFDNLNLDRHINISQQSQLLLKSNKVCRRWTRKKMSRLGYCNAACITLAACTMRGKISISKYLLNCSLAPSLDNSLSKSPVENKKKALFMTSFNKIFELSGWPNIQYCDLWNIWFN